MRSHVGAYKQLVHELQPEDPQKFRNCTRMSGVEVQILVNMTGPMIGKQHRATRNITAVEGRVVEKLRFLATGK